MSCVCVFLRTQHANTHTSCDSSYKNTCPLSLLVIYIYIWMTWLDYSANFLFFDAWGECVLCRLCVLFCSHVISCALVITWNLCVQIFASMSCVCVFFCEHNMKTHIRVVMAAVRIYFSTFTSHPKYESHVPYIYPNLSLFFCFCVYIVCIMCASVFACNFRCFHVATVSSFHIFVNMSSLLCVCVSFCEHAMCLCNMNTHIHVVMIVAKMYVHWHFLWF